MRRVLVGSDRVQPKSRSKVTIAQSIKPTTEESDEDIGRSSLGSNKRKKTVKRHKKLDNGNQGVIWAKRQLTKIPERKSTQ
jgi:hypothetical protein